MASVAKTVVFQKWEFFFIKPAVKVNEQCCWHTRLTASNIFETKMLDAIKHVGDDSFVFQQDSAPVRSTQSNCCSAKLSTLLSSKLWLSNSPALNSTDYKIYGVIQQ